MEHVSDIEKKYMLKDIIRDGDEEDVGVEILPETRRRNSSL
jgi:hypothetical protein